jgi:hypothetical protein
MTGLDPFGGVGKVEIIRRMLSSMERAGRPGMAWSPPGSFLRRALGPFSTWGVILAKGFATAAAEYKAIVSGLLNKASSMPASPSG